MSIVFANACDSARFATELESGWNGVAAEFIEFVAVNYLGSLWHISTKVLVVRRGDTVGEALPTARKDTFHRSDLTWAAFVLFGGVPRTRLRARLHDHSMS